MVQRHRRHCLCLVNQDRVEADTSFDDASAGRSYAGLLNKLELILVSGPRHISTSHFANWEKCTVFTIRATLVEYKVTFQLRGTDTRESRNSDTMMYPRLLFPRRLYKRSLLKGGQEVFVHSLSYQSNILSTLERTLYHICSTQ